MAAPKKPQDHKPKAEKVPEAFSFEYKGETYTLKPTRETIKPSWYRKNRHESEVDQMFSMVEALAPDDATLDAYDELLDGPDEVFKEVFSDPFMEHLNALEGASPGESKAS